MCSARRGKRRTRELPGANPLKAAHAALDEAVLAAYGFSGRRDLRAQLFALNLAVAARLAHGAGAPGGFPQPAGLVTADSIRPPPAPRGFLPADARADFRLGKTTRPCILPS